MAEAVRRVTDYIEETCKRDPKKNAVEGPDYTLTFEELVRDAKAIGTALSKEVEAHSYIPVFMEKGALTLSCFYGIVYAGGTYVPVSQEQPAERLMKIINVLTPPAVITDDEGMEKLEKAGFSGKVFNAAKLRDSREADEALLSERRASATDDDPLYVMFTSGTTGTPKGVVVPMKSVIRFIDDFVDIFGINENDRIGNQAPLDFDISVKDLYSSAKTGATLVMIHKDYFSVPPKLMDFLCDNDITILIWAVPALSILSGMDIFSYRVPEKIRKVLFSGQAMPAKQLSIWRRALPDTEYVNLYGPTEITCNCTYYEMPKDFSMESKLPLGKVFPGRKVFIVDSEGKIINEKDKEGEICVSGECMTKGYFGSSEETNKAFFMMDTGEGTPEFTYRTGDLASYKDDGQLYFAGRKDFQIKRMGHRIELEEIENAISKTENVSETSCVFNKENGMLVCFYTGTADKKDVRKSLNEKLPAYMIPNRFIMLESMPLNHNGKIDRKVLNEKAGF
ncbi:MAG: AMP-binding protein [Lachnospiraceae bacterium]|nr:AMP-binding protein [Lachnospiraceae bacterium]